MAATSGLAIETIADDEAAIVGDFIAFMKEASRTRAAATVPPGPITRFNQARQAGCVDAEFIVPAGLPEAHRVGLFAEAKAYAARIRFANATSSSDKDEDIRGMSIKVLGVAGENLTAGATEQDFVLNSHPVMMAANTREFLELLEANEAGGLRRIAYFASHVEAARIARAAQKHHSCHLDIPYWSATPYLFGAGQAVKYGVYPTSNQKSPMPRHLTDTYLTDALRARLGEREATFDFSVQFQTDPVQTPIEDATVEWHSPYARVATIRIPAQPLDAAGGDQRCEEMRFNPWHALTPHRPLGSMNRARREIYRSMAEFRARLRRR